jgi:EmrB/QacA subfamily drug resistance transporter
MGAVNDPGVMMAVGQAVAEEDPQADGAPAPSHRRIVTAALLLASTVTALEQTVVSTAMPSIIAQLHGLRIYPWVFSAYLLAATVTTPLYGKLADLLGRRRVLLFGLALFGIGSMLSGMARSMPELIAMRVVQGLGAGAVGPIVVTLLGDLYTLAERARVQGLFSAVWGLSSLAGPTIGGVLTDRLSWRWVFFVTIPFGLVALTILALFVREKLEPKRQLPIDWWGALLLASGASALLLTVLRGPSATRGWTLALFGLALVLLVGFVLRERAAADPILPLDLLTRRTIAAAIVGNFLIGALFFGIDTYVPLFVQGVQGGSATRAGRALTPLFLAWAVSVAVAAKVVVRFGFRASAQVGTILIAAGTLGLAAGAAWPAWATPAFIASMAAIGLGMGPASLSYIIGVQHEVEWAQRGAATGALLFFRTIGGALGVGLLGATLGLELAHRLSANPSLDVAAALRPETHALLSSADLHLVQHALGQSLRDVFLQMLALTMLGLFCAGRLAAGRTDAADKGDDLAAVAAAEPWD